jgi:hypothetical protein
MLAGPPLPCEQWDDFVAYIGSLKRGAFLSYAQRCGLPKERAIAIGQYVYDGILPEPRLSMVESGMLKEFADSCTRAARQIRQYGTHSIAVDILAHGTPDYHDDPHMDMRDPFPVQILLKIAAETGKPPDAVLRSETRKLGIRVPTRTQTRQEADRFRKILIGIQSLSLGLS